MFFVFIFFFFYGIVSNTGRIHNFFGRIVPARAKQMPLSIYLSARKRDRRSVICVPKLQSLAAMKEFKIFIFVLNSLTTQVARVGIYRAAKLFTTCHLYFSE